MLMAKPKFDTVFHLIGGQSIPNVFAIHNMPARHHVLFATKETAAVADRLKRTLSDLDLETVTVDAYDLLALQKVFGETLGKYSEGRLAVNLTGGTKPMVLMLARVAEPNPEIALYYVETTPKPCVIDIRTAARSPLVTYLRSVREYVTLNSKDDFQPGTTACDTSSLALARAIVDNAALRNLLSKHVNNFTDKKPPQHSVDFDEARRALESDLRERGVRADDFLKGLCSLVNERGKAIARRFLAGAWLEDYAFGELQGRDGLFDVQENTITTFPEQEDQKKQELDVAFCDNYHFYIVECKSGRVEGEYLQKLHDLVTRYGGSHGRGILLASAENLGYGYKDYVNPRNLKKRLADWGNVMLVELPKCVPEGFLARAVRNWAPGVHKPPATP